MAKTAKTAKYGLQLISLIAPKSLESEKSLLYKTFCSNIKLKLMFFKLFSSFKFDLPMWRRLETIYW